MQRDWGASGLAHLTGLPSGVPDFSRAPVLAAARSTAADLDRHLGITVDAAELLAGRAGLLGLTRRGRSSAGGATRLIATRDGWCALTLSRPDDVEAVPALIESAEQQDDPWPVVQAWAGDRVAEDIVARARLLDLPAAVLGETVAAAPVVKRLGLSVGPRDVSGLLVVDLSSMWAGPLCAQLLRRAGATVVKVETTARPDGTRAGPSAFFDWMNGGKLCYAADFGSSERLRDLIEAADVVVESSRPSALRRRALGPDDVAARDGRVWLRITGYGSDGECANRAAFGDDAAVSGGLVGRSAEGPVFCGDAIADPLTGLHSALSVAESLARGGGELVDVAMAAVAAGYALQREGRSEDDCPAMTPRAPVPQPRAAKLGADNHHVERIVVERRLTAC
ncbi:CoA transferase [Mycobacterium hodleri]|uniref:CoA transferase n=2 Tax=Mycolicibacterium hodleri TaxID=49897 RepID=A0A502DN68_9MYCO|nr:CoA transferase [Mycolicibacterium hodleri]TPG25556.1 CoA transferase [Mycolicibacterium hodleri]